MPRSAMQSSSPPPWLASVDVIAAAFAESFEPGVPRYLQLQHTVTRLIRSGRLQPGVQLPPDQQLTAALGISLGTVQKTLGGLAAEGWISREHGRGTFVAEARRPLAELWHYRFVDPATGDLLPVYSRLLDRRKVPSSDWLSRALGPDAAGYVAIERLVDIGGVLVCYSELYLAAGRFVRILELPAAAFESVNLKTMFAEEFGAPTITVQQFMRAVVFEPRVAGLMGLPKRAHGMLLEITAFTHGRTPLSFQRIHIPPTEARLDLSPVASVTGVRSI